MSRHMTFAVQLSYAVTEINKLAILNVEFSFSGFRAFCFIALKVGPRPTQLLRIN
jgi:hypothetical protein